ncbi:CD63 antigen-like [Teleopsis dalmanni]|uniref:CD63 antigen-like n=1 Tax=Teleopsis dalmanni TaxID=139649 RepID=UPI0018CE0CC0|nr:CD63 antigen-like [Teleopsis dalmanni]
MVHIPMCVTVNLGCCGTFSSSDWEDISENKTLPASCCEVIILNEAEECTAVHANKEGCLPTLLALLDSKTLILAGVVLCVAGIQLLTIIFACCLYGQFRSRYQGV